MENERAKPKTERLNSKQVEMIIEALAIVLTSSEQLEELFGSRSAAVEELNEAREYLTIWLARRRNQLRLGE